jgi:hypothetical protein
VSADEFYFQGGEDYGSEGDQEPQVIDDLSTAELDQHAQEIYGLESWGDVEQLWQQQDAERAAQAQAEQEAALADAYGNQRLGQLTRTELERSELDGDNIHLPALHDTVAGLLGSREWLIDQGMPSQVRSAQLGAYVAAQGEPLIARALAAALQALGPAKDETDLLRRRKLRLQARGA